MTAMTVPPPGWVPIGAPELQANARRYFRKGLALSGLGHLTVLAVIVWIHSGGRVDPPRSFSIPVDLIPTPPLTVPPSIVRPRPGDASVSTDEGVVIPVQGQPEFDIDPSLEHEKVEGVAPGSGPVRGAAEPARGSGPAAAIDDDPGETIFIPRDEEPVAIHAPEPPYPTWAKEAGISGSVVLHVLVGSDGHVRRVTVLQDVKGLTEEARNAVARWVFKPARAGGRAVAVWVAIRVNFRLDGRD